MEILNCLKKKKVGGEGEGGDVDEVYRFNVLFCWCGNDYNNLYGIVIIFFLKGIFIGLLLDNR